MEEDIDGDYEDDEEGEIIPEEEYMGYNEGGKEQQIMQKNEGNDK